MTDAARRVLRTFFAFGIIDNPPRVPSRTPAGVDPVGPGDDRRALRCRADRR
ncbi:hypothetical protein NKG05_27510 [Oerskovia sp. M15]